VTIEIRRATASDVPAVVEVLAGASAWLASRGVDQWPERFSDSFISATAERGELYVAVEEPEVVGTITLQWSDPMFWAERCDAGFFHRLAIRRSHTGLGRTLIDWADNQSEQRGRPYLCMDVVTSNRRLRDYYEALGFQEVDQIEGPREHPHSSALGRWQATLYQRPVRQYRELSTRQTLTSR
jgi:ribosomal protein S18 acetylase RimI-like enzyme